MTRTFDDRLRGHDDVESLMNTAETIAAELGREHALTTACPWCIRETPLARTMARDLPKAKQMAKLDTEVRERVVDIAGEHSYWVTSELTDAYSDAYYGALADPADCEFRAEAGHTDPEEDAR